MHIKIFHSGLVCYQGFSHNYKGFSHNYGLCEIAFKKNYRNHTNSFRHEKCYRSETRLGNNRALNKRSVFINKWRNQNKYFIKNLKLKDSMD